jgi:hypothetical protein
MCTVGCVVYGHFRGLRGWVVGRVVRVRVGVCCAVRADCCGGYNGTLAMRFHMKEKGRI